MTKPTLVARQEFIDTVVNLINTSGLPLVVVQPVLKGLLEDVDRAISNQYLQEKAAYETELAKKNENVESAKDTKGVLNEPNN